MEGGNDGSSILAQETQIQQPQRFLGPLAFVGKKMNVVINKWKNLQYHEQVLAGPLYTDQN